MRETPIGVDILSATLDAHRLSDGAAAQFNNNKAGFRELKAWLKGHDLTRIVFEPTGPYHRNFEVAFEADYPRALVNPPLCAIAWDKGKNRSGGRAHAGHDGGGILFGSASQKHQ